MSTELQEYHGYFSLGTDRDNFSIGSAAITLTTGRYFIAGYTGETQLCEHIQAAIRAEGTYASATVSYDRTTARITIATGGAAAALTWTDSALGTLLGFVGNQTSATSHTATNQPRYVWRPSEGPSDYPLDLTAWWGPRSSTRAGRAPDGTSWSIRGAGLLWDGQYAYSLLPAADVFTSSTTVWRSLQQFWIDVVEPGMKCRIYPDRTAYAAGNYVEGLWSAGDQPIGAFVDYAKRHFKNNNGLWNISFRMDKFL